MSVLEIVLGEPLGDLATITSVNLVLAYPKFNSIKAG